MASEPPFVELPDDQPANEGIQPFPPDPLQGIPPIGQQWDSVNEPSAVPQSAECVVVLQTIPPAQPQPGFWLGVLATLFMFIVSQVVTPLAFVILVLVAHSSSVADFLDQLGALGTKEG